MSPADAYIYFQDFAFLCGGVRADMAECGAIRETEAMARECHHHTRLGLPRKNYLSLTQVELPAGRRENASGKSRVRYWGHNIDRLFVSLSPSGKISGAILIRITAYTTRALAWTRGRG
jgi:hypothetical protein